MSYDLLFFSTNTPIFNALRPLKFDIFIDFRDITHKYSINFVLIKRYHFKHKREKESACLNIIGKFNPLLIIGN